MTITHLSETGNVKVNNCTKNMQKISSKKIVMILFIVAISIFSFFILLEKNYVRCNQKDIDSCKTDFLCKTQSMIIPFDCWSEEECAKPHKPAVLCTSIFE